MITPEPGSHFDPSSFEQWILDNGMGIPLILSAAPTTAGGELMEKQFGFFGTNLYAMLNGSTYKFTGTLV